MAWVYSRGSVRAEGERAFTGGRPLLRVTATGARHFPLGLRGATPRRTREGGKACQGMPKPDPTEREPTRGSDAARLRDAMERAAIQRGSPDPTRRRMALLGATRGTDQGGKAVRPPRTREEVHCRSRRVIRVENYEAE